MIQLSKNTPDSPAWQKIMDPDDKYIKPSYNRI